MDIAKIVKNKLVDFNISNRQTIVVGVSGGLDSMILLWCLHQKKQPVVAAHINYHFRDEASNLDQKLVEDFCATHQIKLFVFEANPTEFKNNLQAKARHFRYAKFAEVVLKYPGAALATAHHFNDALETFLINFSRGSGLKGLTGIQETAQIIRPLLDLTKDQLLEFALKNNIAWREDASNQTTKYIRNKIRHQVAPVLQNLEERSTKAMQLSLQNLKNDHALLEELISVYRKKWMSENSDLVFIDLTAWQNLSQKQTLLFHLLLPFGEFNVAQICDAIKTQPGKKFSSATHNLYIDRNQLVLEKQSNSKQTATLIIESVPAGISAPIALNFEQLPANAFKNATFNNQTAWLDLDKLTFPLMLRLWKEGDKFQPLGMKGQKKVSDFFTDAKVPIPVKNKTYVLLSGNKIIWLVGFRVDENFKVSAKTNKLLRVTSKV